MEDSKVCPFSKLKSSNLDYSNLDYSNLDCLKKTPCPVLNSIINMGYLNPEGEFTYKNIRSAFRRIKVSDNYSFVFFNIIQSILRRNNKKMTVKCLQTPNLIEHDVSLSREDYNMGRGNHICYNRKRFNLIFKYFKDQKYISLKELIEYKYSLFKKSCKENDNLQFGVKEWTVTIVEMAMIYRLLSTDKGLCLKTLQKVFANETLRDVEINSINLINVSNNFIQSAGFWFNSVIKDKL
jgi:hypothetical protein